jgi:outer membrane protein, heavy metal efflux system
MKRYVFLIDQARKMLNTAILLLVGPSLGTIGPTAVGQQKMSDTVTISLPKAEAIFLQRNLLLLVAKYNIDATRATVQQARLWNNPNLAIEQNIYNYGTKRYVDFTRDGNTEFALQQLFVLAGKRGHQVHLAEINTDIAEHTFYDVMRSLRLELRTDLYDLFFLQQSLSFYDESVSTVHKTVESVQNILDKRSVLLSEVLRVKSLLFTLESERLALLNRISQIQWDLHLLFQDSTTIYYIPELDRKALDGLSVDTVSLAQAIDTAKANRPDLKIALANVESAEANLSLQKALAVPDVTIGGRWSRAGSYIPDYYALSVAVDLPIFNRNGGNILQAEFTLLANNTTLSNTIVAIEKDVATAYEKASSTDRLYKSLDRKFTAQYQQLVQGMIRTYENRNISVIQFTDFYESYRTSVVQLNQLQNDRLDAFETLNYVTGANLVSPK